MGDFNSQFPAQNVTLTLLYYLPYSINLPIKKSIHNLPPTNLAMPNPPTSNLVIYTKPLTPQYSHAVAMYLVFYEILCNFCSFYS